MSTSAIRLREVDDPDLGLLAALGQVAAHPRAWTRDAAGASVRRPVCRAA